MGVYNLENTRAFHYCLFFAYGGCNAIRCGFTEKAHRFMSLTSIEPYRSAPHRTTPNLEICSESHRSNSEFAENETAAGPVGLLRFTW